MRLGIPIAPITLMNRWVRQLGVIFWIVVPTLTTWAQAPSTPNAPASTLTFRTDPNLFASNAGLNGAMVGRVLVALVVVIILAVGVLWLSKRLLGRWGQAGGTRIHIRETCSLGPRKALHWVEAGNQRFLIASTADRVVMLSELLDDSHWDVPETSEEHVS